MHNTNIASTIGIVIIELGLLEMFNHEHGEYHKTKQVLFFKRPDNNTMNWACGFSTTYAAFITNKGCLTFMTPCSLRNVWPNKDTVNGFVIELSNPQRACQVRVDNVFQKEKLPHDPTGHLTPKGCKEIIFQRQWRVSKFLHHFPLIHLSFYLVHQRHLCNPCAHHMSIALQYIHHWRTGIDGPYKTHGHSLAHRLNLYSHRLHHTTTRCWYIDQTHT